MRKWGVMLAFMILIMLPALSSCLEFKDIHIPEGGHYLCDRTLSGKAKAVEIEVRVNSTYRDSNVDVYIMSFFEINLYPNQSFLPTYAEENISGVLINWVIPDDQTYYVIIDNADNNRTADALPTGDVRVSVSIEYESKTFESLTTFLVVIAIILAIFFVVLIIAVMLAKKKAPPSYSHQSDRVPYGPQPQYPVPHQEYVPPCPECGGIPEFVTHYNKWYCHNCKEFKYETKRI